MHHPNIIALKEHYDTKGGRKNIVMEMADGDDIEEEINLREVAIDGVIHLGVDIKRSGVFVEVLNEEVFGLLGAVAVARSHQGRCFRLVA